MHLAFELEAGRRRAVEEAAVDGELDRRRRARCCLAGEARSNSMPVRHVVFDHEGGLADRRALGIGEGAHPPGAGRRGGVDRHVSERPPRPWSATTARRYSTPSGRSTTSVSGTPAPRRPQRVAQQRRHVHGLAGAIDAALGIDEGIEPVRRRAAGDAAIGQIEGRRFQVEEGVVGLASAATSSAGDSPPSPRVSRPRTATWPVASVVLVASTSLLRDDQPHLDLRAWLRVVASELTKTWMPSLPE